MTLISKKVGVIRDAGLENSLPMAWLFWNARKGLRGNCGKYAGRLYKYAGGGGCVITSIAIPYRDVTRGSADGATPGWVTESCWDSRKGGGKIGPVNRNAAVSQSPRPIYGDVRRNAPQFDGRAGAPSVNLADQ